MATLAPGGRITREVVDEERDRLEYAWACASDDAYPNLSRVMTREQIEELDVFDQIQLEGVLKVCSTCDSLSDVGRTLFASSRAKRASTNDSDRIRKYLAKFGLTWSAIKGG